MELSAAAPKPLWADRTSVRSGTLLGRADLRNIGILLLGAVFIIALIPPVRSYPMNDDWAYFRSVGDLLQGSYAIPDWSQATAFSHVAWGALFCSILGYSFGTASIATLVMSVIGLTLFYLLLRHLSVTPGYAFLGVGLLAFNPIYFHLSYSFMTDVTFLSYLLAACLCYVRGLHGYGDKWLWLGSMACSLAYLTRQFGLLLVVAVVLYLWLARAWTWKRAVAVTALPIAVFFVYAAWEHTQPAQLVSFWLEARRSATTDPFSYLVERSEAVSVALAMPGLCLLPLLRLPRRPLLAVPIFVFVTFFQLKSATSTGSMFPWMGNIVDHTGFVMGSFYTASIWVEWVWGLFAVIGALSVSLFIVTCLESAHAWWREGRLNSLHSPQSDAVAVLYIFGLLMVAVILAFTPLVLDRYLLPVLVVAVVAALRRMSSMNTHSRDIQVRWRWVAVLPLALFCLIAQRDYSEHAQVRWDVAESLTAQGVSPNQIYAGFEWAGWYQYRDGVRQILQKGDYSNVPFPAEVVLDPVYIVGDVVPEGYTQYAQFPYISWLNGGETRYVRLLHRK